MSRSLALLALFALYTSFAAALTCRINTKAFFLDYPSGLVGNVAATKSLVFSVQASNDAHILLGTAQDASDLGSSWEIVLGGWSNSRSVLRAGSENAPLSTYSGVVLSSNTARNFWISWADQYLRVGTGLQVGDNEIMKADRIMSSINSRVIQYAHVSTGWGSTGAWNMCPGIPKNICPITTSPDFVSYNKGLVVGAGSQTSIVFDVKAFNDAHILIGSSVDASDDATSWEIVLGGWKNTKSVIRAGAENAALDTYLGAVLSSSSYRSFWISWADQFLRVGTGITVGVNQIMMIDRSLYSIYSRPIQNVHIGTGWSSSGSWHMCPLSVNYDKKTGYIGCFADNGDRDMGYWPSQRGHTVATGRTFCKQNGFSYFAIQDKDWLVCSNNYATSSVYSQQADSKCPKGVGGPWLNAVYFTEIPATDVPAGVPVAVFP